MSKMNRTAFVFILVTFMAACQSKNLKTQIMDNDKSVSAEWDTTPRVTGIGGVFFSVSNPRETREWYGKNLGLAINDHGSPFEFRNANDPEEINYLQWSPFDLESDYFKPSKREFMINYRVNNLDGLLNKLKANGVTILDSVAEYEYGKFIHILDNDGNKIELWEPIDSVLTQMGAKTTK